MQGGRGKGRDDGSAPRDDEYAARDDGSAVPDDESAARDDGSTTRDDGYGSLKKTGDDGTQRSTTGATRAMTVEIAR